MGEKRSWWQQIKIHPVRTVLIALLSVVVVLIVLSILGYIFNWHWTGLVPETNEPKQHWKTLWDWLQLLIIPAVLLLAGSLFTYTVSRNERKASDRHNQTEREIAQDNQREAALQEYIDKMSELLLHEKLRESAELDEIVTIARVRTFTVLPRLDAKRKGSLLEFLKDARLISRRRHIIGLWYADLSFADLNYSVLGDIDLDGANLDRAMMGFSNLNSASLYVARLNRANLFGAILRGADLRGADLRGANLSRADLRFADLSNPNIEQVLKSVFDMKLEDLQSLADERVGEQGADLSDADLSGANLKGAKVTDEQLTKAKSLKGATMPDGSIHA
jgi:hypothetical protein